MASYNRVILMGNLTRDPQLKYLPSNTAVCEFGLAVNHRYRDKDGNQRDEVCFIDVNAFGKQAETINQWMTKGRPILVEGRLKLDTWTGQDGQKRSKHRVVVDNFQFVGAREGGAGGGAPAAAAAPREASASRPAAPGPAYPPDANGGYVDEAPPPASEEIPF